MNSMDYGNLAYLVLLGAVVGFWFLIQNRNSLGRVLQQASVWGLIFLGAIAAVGLWDDIRTTVRPQATVIATENRIEIPRRSDGHYGLTLEVNGVPVDFMVDTGASMVVLSRQDAERVGIPEDSLQYYGSAQTANGTVRTAPVQLDSIGPFDDRNFRAWVNEGQLSQSLLGMSYLQRFASVEIRQGEMVLTR